MPKRFDEDLHRLRQSIQTMGSLAQSMVRKTIDALVNRQPALAREVLAIEARMDVFQREIDAETVRLIGVYTPVASDLRYLLMGTRINAELERIGDQAVTICHTYENLAMLQGPPLKPLEDLPRMAALAEDMLHKGLEAFLTGLIGESLAVIEADNEVDRLHDQIFRELLTYMVRDPGATTAALGLILTARGFERIADHAVNIAEDVVYIVRGEDIRHTAP